MKLRNESSDNEQMEDFSQYSLYSYTQCLVTPRPAVNIALITLELREFNRIAF